VKKFTLWAIGILALATVGSMITILLSVPPRVLSFQSEFNADVSVPFFLEGLEEGSPMPEFKATTLDGKVITSSDLLGKEVIIKFWSPRCPYCRKMIPEMREQYANLDANTIYITVVSGVPEAEVAEFAQAEQLAFPIILDESNAIKGAFEVKGVPYTYRINPAGRIIETTIGAGSDELCPSATTETNTCEIAR
jgi:peroxiredoxin